MSKKNTLTKNYIVEKSKPLIWSKFSEYNLGEMRLIDTYLAKINAREEESSEVVFTIDEYLRLLGYEYPNKLKSSEIEKSLDKLLGSRIKIDLNNNGDYIKVNLFSDARVIVSDPDFGKRTITIDCNPKLKEAFFGLAEKGYIEYTLDYSLRLKSKYSLKLYPLLKDKLYRREWTVELKDLRELMGATNKNNESFREFNKVLQKCKKDINEVTDIEFEYEKITKGRLTRAIKFKIKKVYCRTRANTCRWKYTIFRNIVQTLIRLQIRNKMRFLKVNLRYGLKHVAMNLIDHSWKNWHCLQRNM